MSLLTRLGRPEGMDEPKPIFAERRSEQNEDAYQEMKLEIHRRIVDEMSAEQQQLLSRSNRDESMIHVAACFCLMTSHPAIGQE